MRKVNLIVLAAIVVCLLVAAWARGGYQKKKTKKPPLSAFDLITAWSNTRQASVLLREVTRLHCEEALKKIRAMSSTGIHKTNSQP